MRNEEGKARVNSFGCAVLASTKPYQAGTCSLTWLSKARACGWRYQTFCAWFLKFRSRSYPFLLYLSLSIHVPADKTIVIFSRLKINSLVAVHFCSVISSLRHGRKLVQIIKTTFQSKAFFQRRADICHLWPTVHPSARCSVIMLGKLIVGGHSESERNTIYNISIQYTILYTRNIPPIHFYNRYIF
jgi:hypothetical protein